MPFGLAAFQETQPVVAQVTFVNADGTAAKSLASYLGGPWRVDSIYVTNDDTIDHVVDLFVRVTATNYLLGSANVPAGTGKAGVPAVDVLAASLPSGSAGLALGDGASIQAAMEVAVAAAHTVTLNAFGGAL